jgi:sulfite exporter TauE/SafE
MNGLPWVSYLSAFLMAALGGLHCAAMCGGLVAALGMRQSPSAARLAGAGRLAAYHAGRLSSYMALGAMAGVLSGLAPWRELRQLQLALYALAGVVLCLLGWQLWRGVGGFPLFERGAAALLAPLRARFASLLNAEGWAARFGVGLLWGLTPCGMVYGALALALLAGSALAGAGLMLAFGLGTVPNLFAAHWLLQRAVIKGSERWRRLGGVAVAAMGAWALGRVLFASGSIALAPFCAVP